MLLIHGFRFLHVMLTNLSLCLLKTFSLSLAVELLQLVVSKLVKFIPVMKSKLLVLALKVVKPFVLVLKCSVKFDDGQAGDNVGLLLRGVDKKEIKRGQILAKSGSITPHTTFKAEVYILKKEEGGRHTPFHNKYRPQFYIRTLDITGEINLPEGTEMIMPGDNVTITVELIYPVALNLGLRFAIREGGRTVGAGQVTEIIK